MISSVDIPGGSPASVRVKRHLLFFMSEPCGVGDGRANVIGFSVHLVMRVLGSSPVTSASRTPDPSKLQEEFHSRSLLRSVYRPLFKSPLLDWSRLRAVHVEPLVAAPAMVVVEVGRKDAAQVPLVENDDVVETFPANAADHALDVARLGSAAP
jgi:hypothetical protein